MTSKHPCAIEMQPTMNTAKRVAESSDVQTNAGTAMVITTDAPPPIGEVARSSDVYDGGFRALEESWDTQMLDVICGLGVEKVFELLSFSDELLAQRVHDLFPTELQEIHQRLRLALLERKKLAVRSFVSGLADALLADLLRYPSR